MRHFLLSTSAAGAMLAAMATVPAGAADLPVRAAPAPVYAPAPTFTWSGLYLGVHGGYGWVDDADVRFTYNDPLNTGVFERCRTAASCLTSISQQADGFVGGGQIGFNWQVNQFVFGVEADASFSDINGTTSVTTDPGPNFGVHVASTEIDWLATIRGRLGFAADRFLFYVTGGFAAGEVTYFAQQGFPGRGNLAQTSFSDTETGWVGGVGGEFALTNNITLRAEYLFYDLGDTTFRLATVPGFRGPAELGLGASIDASFETQVHVVRGAVNFKFDLFTPPAPAPVYTRG